MKDADECSRPGFTDLGISSGFKDPDFIVLVEGGEGMVRRLYGRLRSRHPVPIRYETWEDGERTNDIPIERIIGGPSFRSSQDDDLLEMADLIAYALLRQEDKPSHSALIHYMAGAAYDLGYQAGIDTRLLLLLIAVVSAAAAVLGSFVWRLIT